jgi:predicted O-methyltransferase YrrM
MSPRGRPPKLSNIEAHWHRAWDLATDVSDHYSMTPSEQQAAFTHALKLPKKPTIVELGVTHGKTGLLLAYVAAQLRGRYIGIDNFSVEGSKTEVDATFKSAGLNATILEGDTQEVEWSQPIDYLLVDAGHDRLNMAADCHRWLPSVKPGGLALFHAYNPDIDSSDPHYPVKYYATTLTKSWLKVDYLPYLLIRRKPLT